MPASPTFPVRLFRLAFLTGALVLAGAWLATPAQATSDVADEVLFYREDGLFRYYDIRSDASLPSPLLGGDGYTSGWTSIGGIDLDGGGQDEIFFYRASDGLYRYYDIRPDGRVGLVLNGGDGYTKGWTSIEAIDLDGDGRDEIFFYRASDGLYRYYDIRPDGRLGTALNGGDGYSKGWTSITSVDVDGDCQDEIFFYRASDGLYRYYDIGASGRLGPVINGGDNYSKGWDVVEAIDLDGDCQDEMLFYRADDGVYRYYDVRPNATLGRTIAGGDGYSRDWSVIAPLNLQGDLPAHRVSRFTTFFDCCQARVTNIKTMAAAVNGYVVQPGETFSIDRLIGPRTTEKGYVPAPYMQNGEGACCAVGGGVSQFGTTIHNAVFWGGFQVIDHQPHSGWISRYPLGIEATLVYLSIDYKFRNDTPNPLTIRTSTTSTSVTVELWGNQGGWQITGYHPRGARSSALTVISSGGSEAKRVGASVTGSAPGWVRVVRRLVQGGVTRSQTWWWNYVS